MNAASFGGRTEDQVRKQLCDQKTKVRAKAAAIRRERQKTGGGPASADTLSPLEDILLSTMNPQIIVGIIPNGDSIGAVEVAKENHPSNKEPPLPPKKAEEEEDDDQLTPLKTWSQVNGVKKRRLSISPSATVEAKVTAVHADAILDIERQKLEVARELIQLNRLKLRAKLKHLEFLGVDIEEEIVELQEILKNN